VDAVVFDRPVLATGEDGLLVTRVLTAIAESAKSGRPVDL
jgi:predicted dehydrogenase